MAQVPYNPVPTVAPGGEPTPRYQANVTPDMFGANIAQATQQLGQTADKVGGEIFARGIAMQDLFNHSEAQEADATYMQKAGELHANYSSLQGKDAVDAYPGYIKSLQDTRKSIRDGLSNSMSQKLFDGQSLSTMGRTIFNGAGHAATENKKYAIGASTARVSAIGNRTLSSPTDEDAFQDGMQDTEEEVRAQGALQGQSPEQIEEAVSTAKSGLWSDRIRGLLKTQPIEAGKMLDKASADGEIRGEDMGKLTSMVQQARNTTGARIVSNQVMSGASTQWGAGPVDIKQAAAAIGEFESGNNYNNIGVMTKHGRALGKYQVMEEYLPEFLAKAGLPPMSPAEYLKNPSAQDQTFSAVFGGYMKDTGSFNDAASMWFSGKTMAQAGNVSDAHGTTVPAYISATNKILARNAPLAAKVAMGRSIANTTAPEDPLFGDYVTQRIEADNNMAMRVRRDDEFNNRQTVEAALIGGQSGKLPTSLEELKADPAASDAWDRLQPSAQRRYLGVLAHNAKGDSAWNEQSLRTYQQLKGQAQADPADFIDTDVIGTALPIAAKKELINLQQSLKNKAEGDPRVTRALGQLGSDLQAAGISKTADKEGYYQFVGSLQDALSDFASENKRPATLKDVQTIGARLLQAHTTKGWLWNSQTPMFQVPVPEDEAAKIKADPSWGRLGITPTDQQIQRIFTRSMYQKLYGGSPKAPPGQATASAAPSPPVSR